MLKEVTGSLNLKPGYIFLDATLGGGGHAKEVLKKIMPGGTLLGIDADPITLKVAEINLKSYGSAVRLINDNFRNLDRILTKENINSLDGAMFDLGVSSYQFDDGARGFSIKNDGPLDMRMDPRINLTAYDIINEYTERELEDLIKNFGEERFFKRIAKYITAERSIKPISTTGQFACVIHKAVGSKYRKSKIDPATRTFQAIRIAVNDELGALEEALKKVLGWLKVGSRIGVISFHSLEDRIVKNLFKGYAGLGIINIITKKPITPSHEEIISNPRSRSAKLRVAERI